MTNQRPNDNLQQFEEEAIQLRTEGNILGALEKLEKAVELEKRWYHLYAKASWLYDVEKTPACRDTIQEGLSRFPAHSFWFFYMRAQLRYLTVQSEFPKDPDSQTIIDESIESQKDINAAQQLALANTDKIKSDLKKISLFFPQGWKGCDVNDVIHKVQNLKNEILSMHRSISLFSYINEVEDGFEKRLEVHKQEMKKVDLQHQSNLAYYNAVNSANLESVRITNQAGQSALKACVFLNAGSAVAILALLANVWDKTKPDIGLKIIGAVSLFAFGALLGSISTGFTYLSSYAGSMDKKRLSNALNLSANGLVVISYNLFLIGGYFTLVGIGKKFNLTFDSINHLNRYLLITLFLVNILLGIVIYNVLKTETGPNEEDNR